MQHGHKIIDYIAECTVNKSCKKLLFSLTLNQLLIDKILKVLSVFIYNLNAYVKHVMS